MIGKKVQSKRDGSIVEVMSEVVEGFITLKKADGKEIDIAESTFKRYYTEKIDNNFKPEVKEEPKAIQSTAEAQKLKAQEKRKELKEKTKPVKSEAKKVGVKNKPIKTKDDNFVPIKSLFCFAKYGRKRDFISKYTNLTDENKKNVLNFIKSKKDKVANLFLEKNNIK